MKNRLQVIGLMGVISGELTQLVKACEESGDHKLLDDIAQFRDEFDHRMEIEVATLEKVMVDIGAGLSASLGREKLDQEGHRYTNGYVDEVRARLKVAKAAYDTLL